MVAAPPCGLQHLGKLGCEFLQQIRTANYARPDLQPERVDEICDTVSKII